MGTERQQYLDDGGRPNRPEDPVQDHGIKRVSILFQLEYWVVRTHTTLYSWSGVIACRITTWWLTMCFLSHTV
jgi:hypothetical protein